jgi:hypothetical protein
MPNENAVNEFDAFLADVLKDTPDVAVKEFEDPGDEPTVVSTPILKMETIGDQVKYVPAQAVEAAPAEKPQVTYKTDEGKQEISGAPCQTTVYSKGYVQFKFNDGWRFANKVCLYTEELESMEQFFASEGYKTWKAAAVAAGLKFRKKQG